MFPLFNASGVLPPYMGSDPGIPAASAPYKTDLITIASRLVTSNERRDILLGFLEYRSELKKVGISVGFQLLDGSFTENCEMTRGRPPKDLDLVTFAYLPVSPNEITQFLSDHKHLFDHDSIKNQYKCDAFFVDLSKDSRLIVDETIYWSGLFSHQRDTFLWKGTLQVPLNSDNDDKVVAMLNREVKSD